MASVSGENRSSSLRENVVVVETIQEMKILIAAPGATAKNTSVYADKGREDKDRRVIVEVGDPDLAEDLLERVEFKVNHSLTIPHQYDLASISTTIRGGVIVILLKVSEDRIIKVPVQE